MTQAEQERTISRLVDLERVVGAVPDGAERSRLERVIRGLRRDLGVGVPKRLAARLLGVSVQALEAWVRRGLIPGVRRPGATREACDSEILVVVAAEVARRREAGAERGVVAAALRDLERAGRLPRKLRPNQPARELRRSYLETSPTD